MQVGRVVSDEGNMQTLLAPDDMSASRKRTASPPAPDMATNEYALPKCEEDYMDTDGIRKRCKRRLECTRCMRCGQHCSCSPDGVLEGAVTPPAWTTADLSFVDTSSGGPAVIAPFELGIQEASAMLTVRGSTRIISAVSDLLTKPWYGALDRQWTTVARTREYILRGFYRLVNKRFVTIIEGDDTCRAKPYVHFDAPLPAYPGVRSLEGAVLAPLPPDGWWEEWTEVRNRRDGPTKLITHAFIPLSGYVWPIPRVHPMGTSVTSSPPLWACINSTGPYAGTVTRVYSPPELACPVYVADTDIEMYSLSSLFYDLQVMSHRERRGCKYHLAGSSGGTVLVQGLVGRQCGRFVIMELSKAIRERRGPGPTTTYIPHSNVTEWVLRATGKYCRTLPNSKVSIESIARAVSSDFQTVLCTLSDNRYASIIAADSGCYATMAGPRKKCRQTTVPLRPVRVSRLIGVVIAFDDTGTVVALPSLEPVCAANGHIGRCRGHEVDHCPALDVNAYVNGLQELEGAPRVKTRNLPIAATSY